jgi:hypothetical protein
MSVKNKKQVREITIATGEKLYTVKAEIVTREINGEIFEFGIHPKLEDYGFNPTRYSMSEVRTGLALWWSGTKKECHRMFEEWCNKSVPDVVYKVIMGHPPVTDLPEIYEHTRIENIQRKEWWKELKEILGFTPKLDGLITGVNGKISLDILWLDTKLRCPDGISLKDHIKQSYGDRAEELVSKLIK